MRKGSVIVREEVGISPSLCAIPLTDVDQVVNEDGSPDVGNKGKGGKKRVPTRVTVLHCDLIRDEFWRERPYILLE
jgi:tRNA(His) guanylyltransferase